MASRAARLDQMWSSAPAPRLGGARGPERLGRYFSRERCRDLFQENGGVDDACPGSCEIPARSEEVTLDSPPLRVVQPQQATGSSVPGDRGKLDGVHGPATGDGPITVRPARRGRL